MKSIQDSNNCITPYNQYNKTKTLRMFPSLKEQNNTNNSNCNSFRDNHRSASMSSFINRNYIKYFNKQQEKCKAVHHAINQDQLNTILTRLKRYYNEVLVITQNLQSEVTMLSNQHQSLQFLKEQTIAYDTIVLPNEKVSIKSFRNQNQAKEQIEGKIMDDMKEINDLKEKTMNEINYSKTIEFMYSEEKKKLQNVLDEILDTEQKLHSINNFKKTIDTNLFQTNKKKENAEIVMCQLEEDIDLIDALFQNQIKESNKLEKEIVKKEAYIVKLKADLIKKEKERKMIFEREKKEIIEKIAIINDKITFKFKTELNYIRTILCLNIIQKYFIEPEEFDMKELINSKEYQEIMTDKYTIIDNNGSSNTNEDDYNSKTMILFNNHIQNTKHSDISINVNHSYSKCTIIVNEDIKQDYQPHQQPNQEEHSINDYKYSSSHSHNKHKHKINNNPNSKTPKTKPLTLQSKKTSKFLYLPTNQTIIKEARMTLDELIERYEQIYINKNDMYQYYYNTIDRIRFNRNNFIHCNDKQITLENRKDNYFKRVKKIISHDYKNFVDLIQYDSRFKEFMIKNQAIITNAKERHEQEKLIKINKGFNTANDNAIIDNNQILSKANATNNNSSQSHKKIVFQANELFKHGNKLFREIKSFFEGILSIFSLQQKHFLEESKRKFHKIKKIKTQLNCSTIPFHQYILQLFDYIHTTEETLHLERNINEIFKNNTTLSTLKKEIFSNDKPNNEFISQLLSKSLPNESILFQLLQKDKETITTFKLAFDFPLRKRRKAELKEEGPLIINKETILIKEPLIGNKLYAIKNKGGNKPKHHKAQRSSFTNHDDDDSYCDKDTNQSENKVVKPAHNIIEERIINKLYNPTLSKTFYNRQLNDNMAIIKEMTRSNSKDNHLLCKKKTEIDEISNNLLIYNNPSKSLLLIILLLEINMNDLSNNTYNTIISYILSNQGNYKHLNLKIDPHS